MFASHGHPTAKHAAASAAGATPPAPEAIAAAGARHARAAADVRHHRLIGRLPSLRLAEHPVR
jgi:hypothetical protein